MKFEDAIEYVLQWEGGYSNVEDDRGGETNWGISSRSHPDVDIKNLTREQAIEIYHKEYWEPNQDILKEFKYINKENRTYFISIFFDSLINIGRKNTVLILQRALNATNTFISLEEDGFWGRKTYSALSHVRHRSEEFIPAFRSERAAYYRVLAVKDPSQEKFLGGWLRRAYA